MALAIILSLTACGASPRAVRKQALERQNLRLVLALGASAQLEETANELVRRAEFFSDGELLVELVREGDPVAAMSEGKADLCIVENRSLSTLIPDLLTLDLPYLMKDGESMICGINSDRSRNQLNKLFAEKLPMQVEYAALGGYTDFAADSSLDLTDFTHAYRIGTVQNAFLEDVQRELNFTHIDSIPKSGLAEIQNGKADIVEASLEEILQAEKKSPGKFTALVSGHKVETVFLLSNINAKEALTPKQQAAIEQASVLAAGYCRSLAEGQRKADLQNLAKQEIPIVQAQEKYFTIIGEIYQFREDQLRQSPDSKLLKSIRADAAKNSFPNVGSAQ